MQSSIDNFGKGVLKRANVHISMTYDTYEPAHENISSKTKSRLDSYSKAFWSNLRLRSNNDRKTYRKNVHIFKFNVDLHRSFSSLFIYSDIADFTVVGDIVAPILRVVPFNHVTESIHDHKVFKNLHYIIRIKHGFPCINIC